MCEILIVRGRNFLETDCLLHTHCGARKRPTRRVSLVRARRAWRLSKPFLPFVTFSGIYNARAPFRAVGCASMCVDKKVCSLHVPTLVTLPCFFSFSVVLINPQQSAESAIYPQRSPPTMSTQFSDFRDLTQQRSCDSFPLRCRVAHVH